MFDRTRIEKVFSKIDLKTRFHQIRMISERIEQTAVSTKYGQCENPFIQIGACNQPVTVQKTLHEIFQDCIDEFMNVHIDDLLFFSNNIQ